MATTRLTGQAISEDVYVYLTCTAHGKPVWRATPEGTIARYDVREDAVREAEEHGAIAHLHEEEDANGPGLVYVVCDDAACEEG